VVAALLAQGESSRLYRTLVREKQLALSVDADNSFLSRDPSLFTISAEVLPGKSVEAVDEALLTELGRLQSEPVGARELEKAKNQLEAAFVFGQDSLFGQGMLLARYEIVSSWRDADKYVPLLRAVSAEDVARVAKTYLVPENCTSARLVPLPSKGERRVQPGGPEKGQVIR